MRDLSLRYMYTSITYTSIYSERRQGSKRVVNGLAGLYRIGRGVERIGYVLHSGYLHIWFVNVWILTNSIWDLYLFCGRVTGSAKFWSDTRPRTPHIIVTRPMSHSDNISDTYMHSAYPFPNRPRRRLSHSVRFQSPQTCALSTLPIYDSAGCGRV